MAMPDSSQFDSTRRRILKATGAAGLAGLTGLAGCSSNGDGGGGSDGSGGDGGADGGSGGGGGGQSDSGGGDDETNSALSMGFSTYFRGGAWITAFLEATEFYAKDQNFDYN
ncbi:hypothetical protein ACFQGE_12540, partial [Halomicroarcula sp. GCM10025817]